MMNRLLRFFLLSVFIGSALSLLLSCERKEQKAEPVLRPVRSMKVVSKAADQVRTFAGVAQKGDKSFLSFRVKGKIDSFPVKVGDKLGKGKLIASLDPTDFELKVQEAEAGLVHARAQERNALANYDRTRLLYENRNASLNDLDIARADAESKKAAVVSSKKQLGLARRELAYTQLRAPISCSIVSKDVEVNENVNSGQAVITADCGTWEEVKVDVPERFISEIKSGMPVSVAFDTIAGETFSAVVTEVGVGVSGTATTYPVTVRQAESNPKVRSGMAAQVTFRFHATKGRIIVPLQSVGEDRDGRFVFVLEKKDKDRAVVKRRAVTIGALAPITIQFIEPLGSGVVEGMEILEGLEDNELIATAGVKRLIDGTEVKLLAPKED